MVRRSLIVFLGFFVCFANSAFSSSDIRAQNGLFPDEIISADGLKEAFDRHESFILFDARNKESFESAHIQGAVLPCTDEYRQKEALFKNGLVPHAPDPEKALETATQKYSSNTPIVTYCNVGCHASAMLAVRLKQLGFTNVKSMEEGFQAWEKKGYPVARASS